MLGSRIVGVLIRMGIGSTDDRAHASPLPVAGGRTFRQISAGFLHNCGIDDRETAFAGGATSTSSLALRTVCRSRRRHVSAATCGCAGFPLAPRIDVALTAMARRIAGAGIGTARSVMARSTGTPKRLVVERAPFGSRRRRASRAFVRVGSARAPWQMTGARSAGAMATMAASDFTPAT